MNNKAILAVVGLAVIGLTGCTSISKTYPINRVSSGVEIMPLNRNEYKVLGDTKGEACAKYFLGGKLPWFSGVPTKTVSGVEGGGGSFLASLPIIGTFFGGQPQVIQEATYEALEKVPGADALLSVRVRTLKKTSVPLFYREECVTVQGKAFSIRTDAGSAE
ncbi:MAG: hypothetical protein A2021_08095 [Elusimicrobia bacterium GWF2_52_66]|nr:MAG: hypothetical protein A2X33_05715 [Elusimicrobia bacterium GWA2_51_34]OGR85481.1 MAG: hypothetical protein A2021_08095 [Elusimicrobia bacterium GWF2_52_66]HAF94964.1 hypothetical protein [Elusimicrobiota bacterium]HCE99126.1 hypothetical protein [Elusimicrobiota bacterium]